MAKEGQILKEMLEIAAQRDSLIALLEADRQRYSSWNCDVFPLPSRRHPPETHPPLCITDLLSFAVLCWFAYVVFDIFSAWL